MSNILSAIACNLDTPILLAAMPLFESEKIQAIEWSFDALFQHPSPPTWFTELLQAYSNENRLIGHGVFFSLFSGKWLPEQAQWLAHLRQITTQFRFEHITEHFGFMTGADFHKGAPLPIPFTSSTLAIGIDRLQRIQDACQCPVGLENLAFAYSIADVKKHGDFLAQLIESVNGFIILDLHNLYCQLHNFDLDFATIIALYPLDKVREIHVSGGSWSDVHTFSGKPVRRDTHDQAVPDNVFDLLERCIPLCPNLQYVVLEQIGTALITDESRQLFRRDFLRLFQIVQQHNNQASTTQPEHFLPIRSYLPDIMPLEDEILYMQQGQLSHILETAANYQQAQQQLATSALANSDWQIEQWQPAMIETARQIAQKWQDGFQPIINN